MRAGCMYIWAKKARSRLKHVPIFFYLIMLCPCQHFSLIFSVSFVSLFPNHFPTYGKEPPPSQPASQPADRSSKSPLSPSPSLVSCLFSSILFSSLLSSSLFFYFILSYPIPVSPSRSSGFGKERRFGRGRLDTGSVRRAEGGVSCLPCSRSCLSWKLLLLGWD